MNSYSASFIPYKLIPRKYASTSPQLSWTKGPENTKSYALMCHDRPAGSDRSHVDVGMIYWTIYNIPASVTELPEMKSGLEGLPKEVCSTTNDNGVIGYSIPGDKVRTIMFSIYALSDTFQRGLTIREVIPLINDHMVGKTRIIGTLNT